MGRTIADELKAEGAREGEIRGARRGEVRGELRARRQTLLRLLRNRFGDVPAETAAAVEASEDVAQLDAWLDRVLTAASLDEMGIGRTE